MNGPLASRGWTLQEQLLSRRMVHFEEFEMIWECKNIMTCECEEMDLYTTKDYKTVMETEWKTGSFETWAKIVNEYHKRSLTYDSDFLPALSGLATHLQRYGAGVYLAGLWKRTLHRQLLWHVSTVSDNEPWVRAKPYRAPTWSWASLIRPGKHKDGPEVRFVNPLGDQRFTASCTIQGARVKSDGHDNNGAVLGAELEIHGRLVRVKYHKYTWFGRGRGHMIALKEIAPTSQLEENNDVAKAIHFDTGDDTTSPELYALVLGFEQYIKLDSDTIRLHGLLLCRSKKDKRVAQRVGCWNLGMRLNTGSSMNRTWESDTPVIRE